MKTFFSLLLLEIGSGLEILFFIVALLWIIPIGLFILGLTRLKTKPRNAKILLIVSGIWLLIGLGFCGGLGMF